MDLKLPNSKQITPTLVLMHFLGGSTREWDEVLPLLGDAQPVLLLDMPGFGDAAGIPGYTVAEMADYVEAKIAAANPASYVLVGHSMSGKVSAVIARREQDRAQKTGLKGLVLVAPSPPGPEPMGEEKRHMMLGLLGERHEDDEKRARSYITKNEQRDLPKAAEDRATNEVLRMNRTAWVAWLMHGSREDWAERVGVLSLSALVVAGDKDLSLGPKWQREHTLPHLAKSRLVGIPGCSHLIPMERPQELAALLLEFVASLEPAPVPQEYLDFLASDRVSPRTREVLLDRMTGPKPAPGLLTGLQEQTLRAVIDRVIPQAGPAQIDIASTIMARLATGKGDGWRYDQLPADAEAYRRGLDMLAAGGFVEADAEAQDKALAQLAAKKGFPAARWFEEVRGDAVAAYVAHPATMARIGFSGIGVGGADTPHKGFVQLGPDSPESWEPRAAGGR